MLSKAETFLSLYEDIHSYASLQFSFPENIQEAFRHTRFELPAKVIHSEDPGPRFKAHVTIFYGLSNDDVFPVSSLVEKWNIFPCYLFPEVRYFTDDEEYDVAYVPVFCEDAYYVRQSVRYLLKKDPPRYTNYIPHCTIAYLEKGYRIQESPITSSLCVFINSCEFCTTDEEVTPLFLKSI